MPGGNKISRKQEAAIAALLSQPTLEAAATAAGVSLRTLKGWLHLPEFAAEYAAARRLVLEGSVARLLAATGRAVETLERNLDADRPGDQIRAAVAILEHAHKGVEVLDLEARIATLEELQAARKKP
jgi:hypothetical protein